MSFEKHLGGKRIVNGCVADYYIQICWCNTKPNICE